MTPSATGRYFCCVQRHCFLYLTLLEWLQLDVYHSADSVVTFPSLSWKYLSAWLTVIFIEYRDARCGVPVAIVSVVDLVLKTLERAKQKWLQITLLWSILETEMHCSAENNCCTHFSLSVLLFPISHGRPLSCRSLTRALVNSRCTGTVSTLSLKRPFLSPS